MLDTILQDDDARLLPAKPGQPACRAFGVVRLGGDEHPIDRCRVSGIGEDARRRLDATRRRVHHEMVEWRAGADGDFIGRILSEPCGEDAADGAGSDDGDCRHART